ncbi:MAG: GTPase Era [Lachnospiraceae bacterium]|nr:GTPase Era [Lachnospiraceae bacterium]
METEEKALHTGFAALAGRPNVGKSTLMNTLIGEKIAITSPRPQTTRNRIRTIYTSERGQIIFVDTPGIHKSRNRLGDYMMQAVNRSVADADVVLWLVEPLEKVPEAELKIAEKLKELKAPKILVINKTDTVKPPQLLKVIDAYKDLCSFAEIVPVSALKGDNTEDLLDCIFRYLPEGPMYFEEDELTDQPMRQLAAELIREKILRLMDKEVPHGVAVLIDRMEYRESGGRTIVDIDATIVCEKASHKGIIIGKGGSMLKSIGSKARPDMEKMLGEQVNLKLYVKVRENWRDNDLFVSNFGYRKEDISG